jgi:glycosyltransferase involved in cell wall biosynthesis
METETDTTTRTLVSIVVPTYNEERDIRRTLEALLALSYQPIEIVVVDDSADHTPDIVLEYEKRGVRLIRPKIRNGRCGARNVGILNARGEIVIILNADVLLPRDFVERILLYYEQGADYVCVSQAVVNLDTLYSRYIAAIDHKFFRILQHRPIWTEGFSCRRDAAIAVGMFPDWTPIPIVAGEDDYFHNRLAGEDGYAGRRDRTPYRGVVDQSILVHHIAPNDLRGFRYQRHGRGNGTPQKHFFLGQRRLSWVFAHTLAKVGFLGGKVFLVVPVLVAAARLTRFSPRRCHDWLPFWYARTIALLAEAQGEWDGFVEIAKAVVTGKIARNWL